MDPKMILKGANVAFKGLKTLSELANERTERQEKIKDGDIFRQETLSNGIFDREEGHEDRKVQREVTMAETRRLNHKSTAGIIFSAFDTLSQTAKTTSDIIIAQRSSKAESANIYAEIEMKQLEINAKIENERKQIEMELAKTEADIEHQINMDEMAVLQMEKEHETKMLQLQKDLEMLEKNHADSHQIEMEKLKMAKEENDAKIRRMDMETDQIKAETERYRIDTQKREEYLNKTLDTVQLQLDACRRIQQLEFTAENSELLSRQITELVTIESNLISQT